MGLKPVNCGCGGEAIYGKWVRKAGVIAHAVGCKNCGIQTKPYPTEAEAITAWNRAMSGSAEEKLKAFWDGMSAEMKEEQKKGKWQRRKGSDCWECSQCHAVLENDDLGMHNFYFCYHCGANMMNKSGYMDIEEVHYG